MGIDPPASHAATPDREFRVSAAALGFGHGRDDSQGVLIKPASPSHCWWAFRDGRGGDVVELVRAVTGTSLREAVAVLEQGGPIAVNRDTSVGVGPDGRVAAQGGSYEAPDLDRTPAERVLAVNAEAWRYLTLPRLAERARAYVVYRGVDVSGLEVLEDASGGPLVGHTPKSPTGLVDQLRRAGFTEDEMVDAGWAARRTGDVPAAGVIIDRFRARILVPFKTESGEVVGVAARAVSWADGDRRPKYLNHPRTVVFDKSEALYRPTEHQVHRRGSAVVVEGTLDALAIASSAAAAGMSEHFAPCSQSGLSLTPAVAHRVAAISTRPPIVCGDPDPSGQAATARWATSTMAGLHREVLAVTLPAGMDPLDWLRTEGPVGLLAFSSYGLVDDDSTASPRPRSAGAVVAIRELDAALDAAQPASGRAVESHEVVGAVVPRLGQLAAHVPGEARHRFAVGAADVLAERIDGRPRDWYVDQITGWSTTRVSAAWGAGLGVSDGIAPA
ncbi:hypothetical protein GCM10009795_096460 [Nocardioides hankookensis]